MVYDYANSRTTAERRHFSLAVSVPALDGQPDSPVIFRFHSLFTLISNGEAQLCHGLGSAKGKLSLAKINARNA